MELKMNNDYFYFLKKKCTQKFPIRKENKEVFYKDLETICHLDKNLILTLKHFNNYCHVNNIKEKSNEYKSLVVKLNNLFYDIVKRKEDYNKKLLNLKGNYNKDNKNVLKILIKQKIKSIKNNNNINYLKKLENKKKLKYIENILEKTENNNLIKIFNKENFNEIDNYKNSFKFFMQEIIELIDIMKFEIFFKKFNSYQLKLKLKNKILYNKNNINSYKNLILEKKTFYEMLNLNKILNKENLLFEEEVKVIKLLKTLEDFLEIVMKKDIWELNFFKFHIKLNTIKIENIFSINGKIEISSGKKFVVNNKKNKNFQSYRVVKSIDIKKLRIDSIIMNKKNLMNNFFKSKKSKKFVINKFKTNENNNININNNFNEKNNVEYLEIDNLKLLVIRFLKKKIINHENFLRFIQVFKVSVI